MLARQADAITMYCFKSLLPGYEKEQDMSGVTDIWRRWKSGFGGRGDAIHTVTRVGDAAHIVPGSRNKVVAYTRSRSIRCAPGIAVHSRG